MRAALAYLLCCAAHAGEPPTLAPPPQARTELEWQTYRIFDSNSGLPQNTVLAFAQDHNGYLYVGSEVGLARYDGQSFEPIALPAVVPVHALAQVDETLYIGTDGAGMLALRGDSIEPVPGAFSQVYRLLVDRGAVWLTSEQGLQRCAATCTTVASGVGVRSVLPDGDALWVGTNGDGLKRLEDVYRQPRWSSFELRRQDGLPNDVVISLGRWRDQLWIGAGRGFARWDGERLTVWSAANGLTPSMAFAMASVQNDAQDLWLVATRPGGLIAIEEDDRWSAITGIDGLPEENIQTLFRERFTGALWIGTYGGGIAREERDRFAIFDQRNGLPDRAVTGLGLIGDRLWVATAAGAVIWTDGAFAPLLPSAFGVRQVRAVVERSNGERFVASDRGLMRVLGDRAIDVYTVDNSAMPAVWANDLLITSDGEEAIWVGTGHGLGRWTESRGLQRLGPPEGLPKEAIVQAMVALDERLVVATDAGVLRFVDGRFVPVDDCLNAFHINDLAIDPDRSDGIVVGAREGLIRWAPGLGCSHHPGLATGSAVSHVRSGAGRLVAATVAGLWSIDASGTRQYDLADGLPARELARGGTLAIDARGRIFAGTNRGVGALQPMPPTVGSPSPLRLIAYRDGGAALSAGDALAADSASVRFRFRLLSFDREHRHRYRHQLIGMDPAPSEPGAQTEVDYARLPPGRYEFRLWARDANGVEAAPLSLPFQVAAHWWQRWPSVLLAALLLIGGGVALGRWRMRALQRRASALEAEVDARTLELATANRRLAEAALTDPLTGLRNRRYLAEIEGGEIERTRRAVREREAHADLVLVLLDLDHFKSINDRYGHPAGDAVLVAVADRLRRWARGGDALLRWGGEEFLLLLRDSDRQHLAAIAQRVLRAVYGTVPFESIAIDVRASAGVVAFPLDGQPQADLAAAIARADEALYQAKRAGRDAAMIATAAGFVAVRREDSWTDTDSSS